MTVAEMERLEHAARLAMGGLPDTDPPSATAPKYIGRVIGLALTVMAAVAVAANLF